LFDGGRAFSSVRRESGDIDKCRDLWVIASFGDNGATVAVADENHWPGLSVDRGLRKLDVFGKRGLRVLHHRDSVSVLLKNVGDGFPSGTISECAMHKNNIFDRRRFACLREERSAKHHCQNHDNYSWK